MLKQTPSAAIEVDHLEKTYVVPERGSGFRAAMKSIFHRQTRSV